MTSGKEGSTHAFEALADLFDSEGGEEYLGESVTLAQHMLQTGAAARAAGSRRELVVAAVVHDVGHFAGAMSGRALMSGHDNHHDEVAAAWLGTWFGEAVTEPVRLHVLAKRYLCTTDPAYYAQLSEASKYTMAVQGGRMSEAGAAEFAHHPWAEDAVALRRFDDGGKDPGLGPLSLQDFREDIEALDLTRSP